MSKLDRLFSACRKGDIQKISKLLEPSFWGTVSVNEKGLIGRTALMWAAEKGNVEVCKFLIEKGADMHLTDDLGKTAMFLAALNIRREVYTLFQTLCVTLQNIQDYTPLCYTLVFEKNIEAAKFIIEMGADINGTVDGHNIFYFLSFDCLHFEAYTQAAEFLIESGFDINALDYKGKPPLYYAMLDLARFQNSPVGKISTNLNTKNFDRAALEYRMKIKFVEFLIDKGADVNFESQSISSPLYKAANAGEDDLCRYLIEKGADVKAAIRAANDCNDKKTSAFLRKKL